MISDKLRFRLLFGPYDPPRTQRGRFLVCEMRGKVKVGGYSDSPIPWPVKWKTNNSRILCGELVRAVRHEAAVAVAYHWGVSAYTVKHWRGALEVEFYNPGTRWLQHTVASEHALPSKMQRMTALARKVTRKPKSPEFRRRMSQIVNRRIARQGPINPRHRLWTPAEDRLLGTKSDTELAAQFGRTAAAIRTHRCALGIDLRHRQNRLWTRAEEKLLGTKSDAEAARLLGRDERAVQLRRQTLKIPVCSFGLAPRPWTPQEEALLGRKPDREVARLVGRSLATIQLRRHLKGIPNPAPRHRAWTAEEDRLLAKISAAEVARATNRSLAAIIHRRATLGIPNPTPKRRFWQPSEIVLLGKVADCEIARRLGCSLRSVRTKRINLHIRAPEAY